MAKANPNESLNTFMGAFYGGNGSATVLYPVSSQDAEWLGTGAHVQQQGLSQDWWDDFYSDMPYIGDPAPSTPATPSVPVVPVTPAIKPSLWAKLFPPKTPPAAPLLQGPPKRVKWSYVRPSEKTALEVLTDSLRAKGVTVTGNNKGYVDKKTGSLMPTTTMSGGIPNYLKPGFY